MSIGLQFNDEIAQRIWNNYFKRAERILKSAPKNIRDEIILELKSHLYESFNSFASENESANLLTAIEELGEPEDFLKPLIADKLLMEASKTFNPITVILGLTYNLYSNFIRALFAIILGLGYLLLFSFSVITILKLFIPENVGLWLDNEKNHFLAFGINDKIANSHEILNYWIIPIGLVISFALYIGLTKLLKFFTKK